MRCFSNLKQLELDISPLDVLPYARHVEDLLLLDHGDFSIGYPLAAAFFVFIASSTLIDVIYMTNVDSNPYHSGIDWKCTRREGGFVKEVVHREE